MITQVLPADADAIARAADIIRAGGLIAFPTETVYGLGANALDSKAVAGIFAAKGRPAYNPLIVHVSETAEAKNLAGAWPESAQRLSEHFWPGPLTLVVPTSTQIPKLVTAGGGTVALRVPSHRIAQAILRAAGRPLAAPSANRSSGLSPTRAEHVLSDLNGRIPLIVDGGPSPGGLESTVLDCTTSPPQLLRPGLVTPVQIENVIGHIAQLPPSSSLPLHRSPGMLSRHYAPRTPVELTSGKGWCEVQQWVQRGSQVGWLTFGEPPEVLDPAQVVSIVMPENAAGYAAQLYGALHTLDSLAVDRIVVALPPSGDDWLAVHDRLRRAAAVSAE